MHRDKHAGHSGAVASWWARNLDRIACAREYVWLAGLLVVVVAGLSLVTVAGVQMLASVRAYTHAEGLYAKAQKDAIHFLHQYAASGDEAYFDKFQQAIAVPLGYRRARAELEKAHPNLAVVREGLVQGGTDPDDAAGPVWLFPLLRRVGPATRAIRFWSEADLLVAQLQNVAYLIHEERTSGAADAQRVEALLKEVERINVNLTTLGNAFSTVLGDAAHWTRRVVLVSVLVAALALLALGLAPSWSILKRLKRSEEKFRRLFEQSRDALVFVGRDGRVSFANSAAHTLFGYAPGTALPGGANVRDHIVRSAAHRDLQRALYRQGFVQNLELLLRRVDGEVLDALVSVATIRDRRGGIVGFECNVRDITERKRTERRMQLLERAVEASGNVILVCDATRNDFPLVYVNPAFERMTGYTAEEVIGRDGFFLLSDTQGTSELKVEVMKQALQNGSESRMVLHHNRKDGSAFWSAISFAPIYDADGALIHYVGIQTDVTDSKEAEEALTQALSRERELTELQSRFVSMASHEFRTPLAAILSSAELLERFRDRWDDGRITKHLRRIQGGVHALTNLLENVLVIERAEAGGLHLAAEPLELGAFCRELIEEIQLAQGAEPPVEVDLAPEPMKTKADPHLLRYILSNLLINAIKYSPADHPIRFSLLRRNGDAVFRVADRGIGIPVEDLDRIFDPFHRAGNVETIPGTGLGLSIAQRAADLHGGTIAVDSEEGRGTVVTVSIPLVPVAAGSDSVIAHA